MAGSRITSGARTIADVDQGQSHFTAQASSPGSNGYGIFTLAADGSWTYSANDSQTAIQQPRAAPPFPYTTLFRSSDGTASQLVTVTINGTNDVPVIGGVSTGSVQADVALTALNLAFARAFTLAHVNQDQSNFAPQAATAGSNVYGSFPLAADGSWTYYAPIVQTAFQHLGPHSSPTRRSSALSSDGTASQLVTVTINGTNDVPVIGGVSTGSV